MRWTPHMREQLRRLHADGLSNAEIAQHLGMARSRLASYLCHALGLRANRERRLRCPECGELFAKLRTHRARSHNLGPRHRERPTKAVPNIAQLTTRGGNFDSAKALSFLADHWRRAA